MTADRQPGPGIPRPVGMWRSPTRAPTASDTGSGRRSSLTTVSREGEGSLPGRRYPRVADACCRPSVATPGPGPERCGCGFVIFSTLQRMVEWHLTSLHHVDSGTFHGRGDWATHARDGRAVIGRVQTRGRWETYSASSYQDIVQEIRLVELWAPRSLEDQADEMRNLYSVPVNVGQTSSDDWLRELAPDSQPWYLRPGPRWEVAT